MSVVKKIFFALAASVLLIAGAVVLFPKERLYNGASVMLQKEGVTLCPGRRHCDVLGCTLDEATLRYAGAAVASVGHVRVALTGIEADGIEPKGPVADLFGYRIETARLDLPSGRIRAEGAFGRLEGRIDWMERSIRLVLELSPKAARDGVLAGVMRKQNGKWVYESRF